MASISDNVQEYTWWGLLRPIIDLLIPCWGWESSSLFSDSSRTITGTIICPTKDRVRLCLQHRPTTSPTLLLDLPLQTSDFASEIRRGMSRIALECDRVDSSPCGPLLESPRWAMNCNGRKVGFATRRKITEKDRWLLEMMRMVSTGAGIIPRKSSESDECKYLRVNFVRVVGSMDSESYHLVDPSGCLGQELSLFFVRL
ncbi:protein MIZU-KUSSEI 1-like [Tasmannia lanceolata]|uniref:protein MIZU-KUSSEI 1-like n=1 Tax=Tasmannia lanceolata TaxID=3420 RepID=UPI004062D344